MTRQRIARANRPAIFGNTTQKSRWLNELVSGGEVDDPQHFSQSVLRLINTSLTGNIPVPRLVAICER